MHLVLVSWPAPIRGTLAHYEYLSSMVGQNMIEVARLPGTGYRVRVRRGTRPPPLILAFFSTLAQQKSSLCSGLLAPVMLYDNCYGTRSHKSKNTASCCWFRRNFDKSCVSLRWFSSFGDHTVGVHHVLPIV